MENKPSDDSFSLLSSHSYTKLTRVQSLGIFESQKLGTPLYIAPEIESSDYLLKKNIKYTNKVDIYALGIILFELVIAAQTQHEKT